MLPGLALVFEVEPLGMLFALVASGLWILNSAYSIGYMRGTDAANQTRYYTYFALALASTMGVAFAGNMLTLFVFYELLTLSTYPLVTHYGDDKALKAGRTYVGILMATSIGLLMLAMIWTWQATGTVAFTPGGILAQKADGPWVGVLLFLYMFGIGKAALMPIHRWLPAAMVAPTPVSALLHAVAVVKAGVFAVLKVAVYIFGIDLLSSMSAAEWLAYIAAATLLGASLVAMTKDNLKARLAYSTVSNLAFVVLAASLANPSAILGGGMHVAMHAFGKITLFFCAGAIYVATHKTEISDMAGIGRQMPITMTAFGIGALSVIGLPPLGGAWSKWHLILGAVEADQLIFVAALVVSSMLKRRLSHPDRRARVLRARSGRGSGGHGAPVHRRGGDPRTGARGRHQGSASVLRRAAVADGARLLRPVLLRRRYRRPAHTDNAVDGHNPGAIPTSVILGLVPRTHGAPPHDPGTEDEPVAFDFRTARMDRRMGPRHKAEDDDRGVSWLSSSNPTIKNPKSATGWTSGATR